MDIFFVKKKLKFYNIIAARGPDFLPNTKIRSFLYSVDIYPLLCELLHIDCDFRDGTIFPFMNVLTYPPE